MLTNTNTQLTITSLKNPKYECPRNPTVVKTTKNGNQTNDEMHAFIVHYKKPEIDDHSYENLTPLFSEESIELGHKGLTPTKETNFSQSRNTVKANFPLSKIHNKLYNIVNRIHTSSSSTTNYVVAALTLEIKYLSDTGYKRNFVTIPIKVKNKLSYSVKQDMLSILSKFYDSSLPYTCSHKGKPHQKKPDYTYCSNSYNAYIDNAQQILHSEPGLFYYMTTPEFANSIVDALHENLRTLGAIEKSSVKIYNASINIHSTNTSCNLCEHIMVGALNNSLIKNNIKRMFIHSNYTIAKHGFKFSKNTDFALLTTYSAHKLDKNHKNITTSQLTSNSLTIINPKNKWSSQKIHLAYLPNSPIQEEVNDAQYTRFISGGT